LGEPVGVDCVAVVVEAGGSGRTSGRDPARSSAVVALNVSSFSMSKNAQAGTVIVGGMSRGNLVGQCDELQH
jgi:exopolysaccharide biosynthesis protein